MLRNLGPDFMNWYMALPPYEDGQPAACPECGADCSAFYAPDGAYDCFDCAIWFSDYAAGNPHYRQQ